MSREREEESRRWSDEDLVEWLLDEAARVRVPREVLDEDPEVAERLRSLELFLGECRQGLAREEETDSSVLVDKILVSTTREDLSWRGDLRLVGGFVRQRLRSSRLLRVVAASLLLHVIALPVFAYYAFVRPPAQRTVILFAPTPPELPYVDSGEEPEPAVVDPVQEERYGQDSLAGLLLRERLAAQGLGGLDGFSEPPFERVVWGDSLGLALWCEALMDDLEQPEPAPGRVRLLRFALRELAGELVGGGESFGRLTASTWLRGYRAGWVETDPRLLSICRECLGEVEPLTGEEWERAFREAVGEIGR
jgi:hypothetical protein